MTGMWRVVGERIREWTVKGCRVGSKGERDTREENKKGMRGRYAAEVCKGGMQGRYAGEVCK